MHARYTTLAAFFLLAAHALGADLPYPIVGPGQTGCYDSRQAIAPPKAGEPFFGQDAQHPGPRPAYQDNGDGTITDINTGLTWVQARGAKVTWNEAMAGAAACRVGGHADWRMPTIKELYSLINFNGGKGMNWQEALAWVAAKNRENHLGHADWRLPNAKELQSIVDYTRAPAVTNSPAIDPIFLTTRLPGGDYPYYWTSTTHLDGPRDRMGSAAVYVCFGRSLGWMSFPPGSGELRLIDVHGAGAQRSDPKTGNPAAFPRGRGPQGDDVRILNFVRCVRDAK